VRVGKGAGAIDTNTALGSGALDSNTTGGGNTASGQGALRNNTTGNSNTASGFQALANTTGSQNTAIGVNSGQAITTGSKNSILGSFDGNSNGLDIRTSNNNIILSDGDGVLRLYVNGSGNTGIGTTTPGSKLAVNGSITESPNGVDYYNVVTQRDIGTDPNQIPLNQFLGTMAYQDSNNVVVGNLTVTGQLNVRQELLTGSFTWNSLTSTPDSIYGRSQVVTGIHDMMRGCVLNADGSVNYYLNPTNWAQQANGTASVLTGADGNVMVEIPKFYYRIVQAGTETTWKISAVQQSGYVTHPAFIKDNVEVDFRYMGAYDACVFDTSASAYISGTNLDNNNGNVDTAADKLSSVKGIYPMVGLTRNEFRLLASVNGTGWRQLDYDLWSAVQLVYIIEYQSFFSQNILGAGNTNGSYLAPSAVQANSPHTIAGAGDSIANGSTNTTSGAGVSAKPGISFMKYRGIENFYGNGWNWADGINVNVTVTGNVHITNDAAFFADNTATGMELVTSSFPTASGYIRDMSTTVDPYFLSSTNSGGGSTTYITDYHFALASSNRGVFVGGAADYGAGAGAFCLFSYYASSFTNRTISGRLAY
jgi:hypothetical protein